MKLVYVTLLLLLIALLMGLEVMASRVPAQPLTPARVGDSGVQASLVSGG
jgi:hypothetical protein